MVKINTLSRRALLAVSVSAALALAGCNKGDDAATGGDGPVKVGVLHSLTGAMAISEVTVKNATQMAIDEINAAGGVMGRQIEAVTEDGASDPNTFAQKAQKLIDSDGVVTVFGGWTSSSRQAMLPVFEGANNLLWYPVQFEGNECSVNIMYSGAQPNQQLGPAYDWAKEQGYKKIFLVGSDYVYPRTANQIAKAHIAADGLTLSGEEYMGMNGPYDFSGIIAKIKASKPDIIINTLNGDGNVAFFKQMAAAGMPPSAVPVMSFSIGEQEAVAMGPQLVEGSYAAWNYFQTLTSAENAKFVADYKAKFGADAVVTDPMIHGYLDVYAWKAAVEKAGTFDPAAVRAAAVSMDPIPTPLGPAKFSPNNSLTQTAYVGKADATGQFQIIWTSPAPIEPEPYDAVAFPGKTCSHT